eukprot:356355-Chlamydomonas_euryale.AAC.5
MSHQVAGKSAAPPARLPAFSELPSPTPVQGGEQNGRAMANQAHTHAHTFDYPHLRQPRRVLVRPGDRLSELLTQ